ncbi:hypothetical protein [Aquimarina sp. 2201CG5-10]|uniref:hypothetical protein n=1 Tax=Aquimarina callyspongiae TaxID=3098150 RepID=UPI002AB5DBD5|nr:hypothetical protein [Aquimarina sp. 2201CG5-10]MDY8135710.1 hypothetical protein [Aquimarina sp. 2201CG5-10]
MKIVTTFFSLVFATGAYFLIDLDTNQNNDENTPLEQHDTNQGKETTAKKIIDKSKVKVPTNG